MRTNNYHLLWYLLWAASLSFFLCSSVNFFPLWAALIFCLVSSLCNLPRLFSAKCFLCSSENVLPFKESLNFFRVSSLLFEITTLKRLLVKGLFIFSLCVTHLKFDGWLFRRSVSIWSISAPLKYLFCTNSGNVSAIHFAACFVCGTFLLRKDQLNLPLLSGRFTNIFPVFMLRHFPSLVAMDIS